MAIYPLYYGIQVVFTGLPLEPSESNLMDGLTQDDIISRHFQKMVQGWKTAPREAHEQFLQSLARDFEFQVQIGMVELIECMAGLAVKGDDEGQWVKWRHEILEETIGRARRHGSVAGRAFADRMSLKLKIERGGQVSS